MENRAGHSSRMRNEPIAIIGSACRFPGGSSTPSKLWDLLREPRDVLSYIPSDRFSAEGFYHTDGQYHGHSNVRQSYFLSENVREFDAPFFGVKPVEANATDPQQRLLLETVYEGIESAGLAVNGLRGSKTAVYVGLMCADYDTLLSRDTDSIPTYHATGTARSIISNRISYFFDWRGPSMTIDTACSSSLIAVHQAVQVLRNGDSRVAVAAGSNLILGPEQYIAESKLQMLSPDSRSRMWDADANGYARGEGVAAVILKTLSAALEDGDHIECLIRETGINQDGKTKGITMPSATAQATLIRDTYLKAGLDPTNPEDRCQYFEAHGTGTPAGDPIEAEAISSAFFPACGASQNKATTPQGILYVGSIKTVVGHTEGTAGLAAVMKASLALQNETIPPNLLFTKLNPAIEPYYNNLRVPTCTIDWPSTGSSQIRRASVNSFGFGGANAHAILESYNPTDAYRCSTLLDSGIQSFLPFNFSAHSERTLISLLTSYLSFLKSHASVSLRDLAFTLYSRRSEWPVRASFSASTVEELCGKIDEYLSESTKESNLVGVRSKPTQTGPRILGVFTGQGAQWARMGRDLLLTSEFARSRIFRLDRVLAELPAEDRPSWSIQNELIKDPEMSRINEAELSQPLCTALQILLVDILDRAGVQFTAVVGHSSGEIGAAYTAKEISARDAIRIAYYRGVYAKYAQGLTGQKGAMLAAGTSLEDAQALCELPYFRGRMTVAASNSAASVTLSGDQDRIKQAELVFKDEKKFVRLLKVDKAYHSHHMVPCVEPYLQALRRAEAQGNTENTDNTECQWFSTVTVEKIKPQEPSVKYGYWAANMMKPVLLKEALTKACSEAGPFDIVLEVGPHPALKSPASQTIQEVSNTSPLYLGLLNRGQNDVEAVADCLGTLWAHFPDLINLAMYDKAMSGLSDFKLLKGLPAYSWDHDREYWHEARQSRVFRTRESVHELLGHLSQDSSEEYYRWRNVLRMSEIPWLQGHKLQGQTVFPAAGYIVLALEAALKVAGRSTVRSLEVTDVTIGQALTFNDDDSGIETIFTISDIFRDGETSILGKFTYHGVLSKAKSDMTLLATGNVEARLGYSTGPLLPPRSPPEPNLVDVDVDQFYTSLLDLGYGYSGPFRALSSMKRKLGWSTGLVSTTEDENDTRGGLIVHPGMLDATIQSVLLAYCYPNDGRLWSLHVPTAIRRITADLSLLPPSSSETLLLPFDATLSGDDDTALSGDVDVYTREGKAMLQIEGITCVPFSSATAKDDRKLFSHETWTTATPDAVLAAGSHCASAEDYNLAEAVERTSYYYVRQLQRQIPLNHPARVSGPYVGLFRFVDDILTNAPDERHPFIMTEWKCDTQADIALLISKYGHTLDLQIAVVVGEQIPRVIFEETTILEHLMKDDLLYNYYSKALGFSEYTSFLAGTVAQITNRYPHMNVLEIGAGTGATTRHVVDRVGTMFASYTFTDISNGFFETAKVQLKEQANKFVYKTLDIEADPAKQGFVNRSFDMIIASNVLHATKKLEHTLKNVRRLLKPGGYLVMMEITDNGPIRSGFVFGSLPGWWLGAEDGRVLSPVISPEQWDALLRRTGFSGVDTVTPDTGRLPHPGSVFVSQAVDDKINFLREPLSISYKSLGAEYLADRLIILGGRNPETRKLADGLEQIVAPNFKEVIRVETVAHISAVQAKPATAILSITELDAPLFRDLTKGTFEGFRVMFERADTILWITKGCKSNEPYANMTIGYGRSQILETPGLSLQFLDLESANSFSIETIANALERYCASSNWSEELSKDYLWSIEPELVLDQNKYLISRLVANQRQNDRFNSSRRPIYEELSLQSSAISIRSKGDSLVLRQEAPENYEIDNTENDSVRLRVHFSTLSAVNIGPSLGSLFVSLGAQADSIEQALCFSISNSSVIEIPRQWSLPCHVPAGRQAQYLSIVASNVVATSLLSRVPANGALLVHDPPALLADILVRRSSENAITVKFTVSSSPAPHSWIFVHPRTPIRRIKGILPYNTALFVDFSRDADSKRAAETILKTLPGRCQHETSDSIYTASSHILNCELDSSVIQHFLLEVKENSDRDVVEIEERGNTDLLPIAEVAGVSQATNPASVVQWAQEGKVQVQVSPVDASPMFKINRTYWLVGLTQSLGLSLCEWMVRHGARYVVLSSRNPNIDPTWLSKMADLGATIKCAANDITDKEQVDALYKEICQTLPPVAGIGQGAMVLRDALSRDMDLENLQTVTAPKIKGSIHLDKIFSDKSLDFFVFFSSMATIVGNLGQCNYTAANAFMASLSNNRRKRGLASSVINIGAILGAGYVTQQLGPVLQEKLVEGGHTWMSERAFHQVFAEGVIASDPNSKEPSQISTGLRYITAHDSEKPFWSDNPKFAHQTITEDAADAPIETNVKTDVPLKTQLLAATNREQVYNIIKDQFLAKLESVLQMSSDSSFADSILDQYMDQLGVDSLIAVDLRTWFMKSLAVNMPVLKILGGASIRELLDYTMDNLPQDIKKKTREDPVSAELPAQPSLDISLLKSSIPDSKTPSTIEGSGTPDYDSADRSQSRDKSDVSSEITDYLSAAGDISSPPSVNVEETKEYPTESLPAGLRFQKVEPLSHSQSMFWFVTVYLDDATTLNHTGAYRLRGAIQEDDLGRAVRSLGRDHEILRTCFFADELNNPVQGIMESSLLHLETRAVDDESGAMKEVELMKKHIFNLEQGKTMRLVLLSRSPLEHYLIIGCHHIITDGTSHQVFMADLEKAYRGEAPSTVLQYSTFGNLQRQKYQKRQSISELKFWREEFSTIPSPLPPLLPRHIPRVPLRTYSVRRVDFHVDGSLSNRVRQACRQAQATPFHFYLTIFRLLLVQLTGVEELCIGMAEANRKDERMMEESALGPYVNLLPLYFRSEKQQSFLAALTETRKKVYSALANSDVPFEVLLDEIRVPRSTSHSPLFQSFIDYRQGAKEKLSFSKCELEVLHFEAGRTGYDISLDIIDNPGDDCLLMLMTQGSLYTQEETEFLMSSYTHLLTTLAENVSAPSDIYRPEDKEKALALGRASFRESQWPATLPHRIEDVTIAYGNELAIQDGDGNSLTYAQLNARVQSIAAVLLSTGIKSGAALAVYQEPSSDFISSLLAILRIGAVYVPFDPSTPVMRLAGMVTDASISAIIVHKPTAQASLELKTKSSSSAKIIDISTIGAGAASVQITADPEATATILYTSGSTGKPKGILLTHSNLRNEIEFSGATYSIKQESVLQQSSFGFDMSFTQIFSALAFGGVLHIAPRSIRGDAIALYNMIAHEKITFTAATPSEYVSWLRSDEAGHLQNSPWRTAVSGGENISPAFLQQLRSLNKPDLQVFNSYGPTEITCSATRLRMSFEKNVSGPISAGSPAPNCAVYILNQNLEPVISGFPGEIFVGGAGVASGYLDREITERSFLPDPFAPAEFKSAGWNRMYRTGDTGRWLKDGTILIEGRIAGDTQVKLRGLRIDLQELEQTILKTSDGTVAEVVASVRSASLGGPDFLAAHVVFSAGISADTVDRMLTQTKSNLPLPQYMHPAIVIPITEMPRNANGKLDRKAVGALPLPLPQYEHEESISSDLTESESRLLDLWRAVLPPGSSAGTTIDSLTDFFDIGGNSMLLLNIQAKIRQSFGVTLPLVKLFEAPTIRGMLASIRNASSGHGETIDWEAETAIPTEFYEMGLSAVVPGESRTKVVVLTGASGFLGQGLLRGLLSDVTISKIHCVAVRNPAGLDTLASNPRLVVHSGDLTLPNVGLSTSTSTEIFGQADVVIHNGADVSHLKAFQTLKRANLESTKELVKLCLPRRIPFHYISTAGVALRSGLEQFGEASVAPYVTPASNSDGYTASKWCSEKFLEKISHQFQLQSWIHRPTSIVREGDPGLDLLQNLLKYVKQTRGVPQSTKLRGVLDMVYLDTVVGRVIRSLGQVAEDSMSYVNHSGDVIVPFADLAAYLERENGGEFTSCIMDEWVANAEAAGMNPLVAEVFKRVEEGPPVRYPKFSKRDL